MGTELGSASAVKMCTASVYKGFTGLLLQALRTAQANGVLDHVLADLAPNYPHVADAAAQIASAVAKSDRFPGEMREIARTQADAGGLADLFQALAHVYEAANGTALAAHAPEQAAARTDLTAVLGELEQSRSCVPDLAAEPAGARATTGGSGNGRRPAPSPQLTTAMAGAVDLAAIKARSEAAARAATAPPPHRARPSSRSPRPASRPTCSTAPTRCRFSSTSSPWVARPATS